MNWLNIEIDHMRPSSLFDMSDDDQLREVFIWRNTQHLLKEIHRQKGTKYNFLDYRLQFVKCYQLLKLNEEGLK